MARTGENIYKRTDGRYEARYISDRDDNGKAIYKSVYGHSKAEVREKVLLTPSSCLLKQVTIMEKLKVMSVFGTRPEAIKMAPVVLELCKYPEIKSIVAVTAQHREMLDQVLNLFDIRPDFDLNIMSEGQTLFDITSRALLGLDKVLTAASPDMVLVHGDTTTTFAGALAAYYHQIEVGHVEAGLRTQNKFSPYPEEMNRRACRYALRAHADS